MYNPNCFSYPYTRRYYFTHPWTFVRHTYYGFRAMLERARYGYSSDDIFDFSTFLLHIIPRALRDMADSEVGAYPGNDEFDTPEKWDTWLRALALRFSSLQIDWATDRNEYYDEYMKWLDDNRIETRNADGWLNISYVPNKELQEKFMTRLQELNEQQRDETIAAFQELARNFYQLWI